MLGRYRAKRRNGKQATHLAWWTAGILLFGIGTAFEGYTTVLGWSEWGFRGWYISGALLGGAPLAQGTVYLLLSRRTAHVLSAILVPFISIAALFVLLTPVDATVAEEHILSGDVIVWTWVRAMSPFINIYAFIFLVGGAGYSAFRFRGDPVRARGTALIALGALLPGIGGAFSRAGVTEVLYVGEFIGIILIYIGYRVSLGDAVDGALRLTPNLSAASDRTASPPATTP